MDHRTATLTALLAEFAETTPDRAFLQDRDLAPLTYGEFDRRVRMLAGGLCSTGVGVGDTVLVMLPNGPELVHTWFACNSLGAIQVPVNVHLRGAFLEHVLVDSRASVMVVHASYLAHLAVRPRPPLLRTLVVVGADCDDDVSGLRRVPYDDVACHAPVPRHHPVTLGDVSAIYYTSGTTGPAKGIMSTYGQACVNSRNYLDAIAGTADDVFYCCMPLFHSNAQVLQVAAPLMVGARVSVWPEFSASQWLGQIRSVGATVTNTLGVMMEFVARRPPEPADADNPLRVVQTIPAPPALAPEFERRFGVRCIDGYGLTDVGVVSYRRFDEPLVPGSSGRPVDDFEVIVADPETDLPVPTGTAGEILIRPRVPFGFQRGYWNRPEDTLRAWRNLWFHTGDCGILDEDGLLRFVDRMGDSIRVRGENISSAEIESVVTQHPAVENCAAVAVAADVGDYDVLVVLTLQAGHELDPADLLRFCDGRMPYYAIPRYVDVVDALPMTPTHKVRKVELRERGVRPEAWDRKAAGHKVARI